MSTEPLSPADVEEAADLLRRLLALVEDGTLDANGEDGPAIRAHLEGALRALDLVVGKGHSAP